MGSNSVILLQRLNAHLKSRICSLLLSFLTPLRISNLALSWVLQLQLPLIAMSQNHFFPVSEEQIQLAIMPAGLSSACSKKLSLLLILPHHS